MQKKIQKYGHGRNRVVAQNNSRPSRTKQSFKEECDINTILKKYNKTGQLPDMIKRNPAYGDFSNPQTFHESFEVVIKAQEQFSALPAKVRERFGNSPQAFLEFATDPRNGQHLIEMGLASARPNDPPSAAPPPPDKGTKAPKGGTGGGNPSPVGAPQAGAPDA